MDRATFDKLLTYRPTPVAGYGWKNLLNALALLSVITTTWLLFSRPDTHIPMINTSLAWPQYSQNASAVQVGPHSSKYAYATYLAIDPSDRADHASEEEEKYFTAVRLLTYQLLHAPETKSHRNVPMIVVVNENVSEAKRARLRRDGAIVWEPEHIAPKWIAPGEKRWGAVLQKLRVVELTQFERVCFIDGDTVLTGPMDDVFEDEAVAELSETLNITEEIKEDEAPLPSHYVHGGRPEPNRFHSFPINETVDYERGPNYENAGFFIVRPDLVLAKYYLHLIDIPSRFRGHEPEQNLFNYAHRREGNMPWKALNMKWNVHWPTKADLDGGVVALHTRWWAPTHAELKPYTQSWYDRMVGYYQARDEYVLA